MSGIRDEIRRFVERVFPGADYELLAGDASTRRFFRIRPTAGPTRVLMDYGAPFENETGDIVVNRIFRKASLPVAEILSASPETGCVVLEDLGDQTLESAVAGDRAAVPRLYARAVDLLLTIAGDGTRALERSDRASGPALDAERFRFEMDFFVEHYVRRLMGRSAAPVSLIEQLHDLAEVSTESPQRILCHRDFHSRNLMVRPDGSLAMVDIQDARWGPDSYDLASLLFDAYVDLDDVERDALFETYREGRTDQLDSDEFRWRFNVVATERMIKALGTFGYQIGTVGRVRYATAARRTVDRLAAFPPDSPGIAPVLATLAEHGLFEHPPIISSDL